MTFFNGITVSVFAKPEEDVNEVKQGLADFFPINLEEEKIQIQDRSAKGFNDRIIHIYSITITKYRHINAFFESFIQLLDGQQKLQIIREADTRLDKEMKFFIRADKSIWLNTRKLQITESGDCYHFKFVIASFPKKRETAISIITKVFKPDSSD